MVLSTKQMVPLVVCVIFFSALQWVEGAGLQVQARTFVTAEKEQTVVSTQRLDDLLAPPTPENKKLFKKLFEAAHETTCPSSPSAITWLRDILCQCSAVGLHAYSCLRALVPNIQYSLACPLLAENREVTADFFFADCRRREDLHAAKEERERAVGSAREEAHREAIGEIENEEFEDLVHKFRRDAITRIKEPLARASLTDSESDAFAQLVAQEKKERVGARLREQERLQSERRQEQRKREEEEFDAILSQESRAREAHRLREEHEPENRASIEAAAAAGFDDLAQEEMRARENVRRAALQSKESGAWSELTNRMHRILDSQRQIDALPGAEEHDREEVSGSQDSEFNTVRTDFFRGILDRLGPRWASTTQGYYCHYTHSSRTPHLDIKSWASSFGERGPDTLTVTFDRLADCSAVGDVLALNMRALRTLKIQQCPQGREKFCSFSNYCLDRIAKGLRNNHHLTYLSLTAGRSETFSACKQPKDFPEAIKSIVTSSTTLEHLHLNGIQVIDSWAPAIGEAVEASTVRKLGLDGTHLTLEGAAQVLSAAPDLTYFSLADRTGFTDCQKKDTPRPPGEASSFVRQLSKAVSSGKLRELDMESSGCTGARYAPRLIHHLCQGLWTAAREAGPDMCALRWVNLNKLGWARYSHNAVPEPETAQAEEWCTRLQSEAPVSIRVEVEFGYKPDGVW
eukprot:GFYU01008475.1.p1 GENE.GFYU01008475.1~~GFYU01008475.1.p1  ORF type:complete len:725 (-),score=33.01 GFYU01008475.1:226-2292(-)